MPVIINLLIKILLISILIWYTNLISGDGMYFQWMMAIGAWLVGLVVNLTQSQPPFFSLTMLSGVLWGSGNIFSVPSFYFIGIGIGQTMQGNLNLLGGWISGRYSIYTSSYILLT